MADEAKNVFISHIHEDDEGLGKLKSLLKDNGMTIRDYSINADNPNRAHSEDYIKSQILAPRIKQSSTVVVYISPETKDSKYVNWEIEFFVNQDRISFDLLKTVQEFVRGYEVEQCPLRLWERAILDGYAVFRQVRDNNGGLMIGDREARTIAYRAEGEGEQQMQHK